jgi:ubiquinone/menaquinone biosynthesis C-methylase UbiE
MQKLLRRLKAFSSFRYIHNMKRLVTNPFILLLICAASCFTHQNCSAQKTGGDSLYTYGTASPGGMGKFYLGREIAHIMGASNAEWLDRSSRPQEEHTQAAIDKIEIAKNGVIADIGAGTGYYTFKLAPKVPEGKVYAVEVQDEMIAALNERKRKLNNTNVEIIKGSPASPNLPANSIDLAIMVDVYHELEYPAEMLQAIKSALKKDGRLLLIEYKGEDPAVAIRPLHKTTVKQLNKELSANGFTLIYDGEFLPIQHFLVYTKRE